MSNPNKKEFLLNQFLSSYHSFKLLKHNELYNNLTGDLRVSTIYKYVYSFEKNIYKAKLLEMITSLNQTKYEVRGGQIKLILKLLNFNYYTSHLTAVAFQKIKPTIKTFNSEI